MVKALEKRILPGTPGLKKNADFPRKARQRDVISLPLIERIKEMAESTAD